MISTHARWRHAVIATCLLHLCAFASCKRGEDPETDEINWIIRGGTSGFFQDMGSISCSIESRDAYGRVREPFIELSMISGQEDEETDIFSSTFLITGIGGFDDPVRRTQGGVHAYSFVRDANGGPSLQLSFVGAEFEFGQPVTCDECSIPLREVFIHKLRIPPQTFDDPTRGTIEIGGYAEDIRLVCYDIITFEQVGS
ncbi:MAG: hypothetical protein VYE40_09205 [Myxococcota bacterium]|nr:hypothetical protein [Myxococcota bacterium]